VAEAGERDDLDTEERQARDRHIRENRQVEILTQGPFRREGDPVEAHLLFFSTCSSA
jgi:hypothetical protein